MTDMIKKQHPTRQDRVRAIIQSFLDEGKDTFTPYDIIAVMMDMKLKQTGTPDDIRKDIFRVCLVEPQRNAKLVAYKFIRWHTHG